MSVNRLTSKLVYAVLGLPSTVETVETWEHRPGESMSSRVELLEFFDKPSAKTELLFFIREQKIPRGLATELLEIYEIPIVIPAGAMNVLGLGNEDGSPLDYPVFWDTPTDEDEKWCWRRSDRPIVAVQLENGSWECQGATY